MSRGVAVGLRVFTSNLLLTISFATYSKRGGRAARGRKIRAILPSLPGRIAIVPLGGRIFGRRLVDGKGIATRSCTSLCFHASRIITGV